MLQVRFGVDLESPDSRTLVGCGANSYHGPASTSPGGKTPLGARAKGLTHPVRYPVPTPFTRFRDEDDASFHARKLAEFDAYLDAHGHELGVLLVEPQWGSSVAAMPWPPALLREYVKRAQARNIMVVCDEIMCGIGRHGQAPAGGGTGCFLAECWDLRPDVVTFGKAIGGGVGHLLSGAVLMHGAGVLELSGRTAFQSHTYAGSSARALANGAALLEGLESYRPAVKSVEAAIEPALAELNEAADGAVLCHGQGALWGGMWANANAGARAFANLKFKKKCAEKRVLPYYVPVGGFMLTPRYDDDPDALASAVRDLSDAALATCREMGWAKSALMPMPRGAAPAPSPRPPKPPRAAAFAQPDDAASAGYHLGPLGASAPLADATKALGAAVAAPSTSLDARESSVAVLLSPRTRRVGDDAESPPSLLSQVLLTAYSQRAAAAWSVNAPRAREAGLEEAAIHAIARGVDPQFKRGSRDAAIYAVASDLLYTKKARATRARRESESDRALGSGRYDAEAPSRARALSVHR